jgi:hypothetical protein
MFTPRLNNLSGVPPATLLQWLTESQQALHDLSTGAKGESFSYAQGDGSKSVTYTRADIGALQAHILALQYALGMRRRRAIRPVF